VYVNRTQAAGAVVSSLTIPNHFVDPTGTNQALIVLVAVRTLGQFPRVIDVSYAGHLMTLNVSNSRSDGDLERIGVGIFSLVDPPDGLHNAVITFRDDAGNPVTVNSAAAAAISLYGVHQSNPVFNGTVLDGDVSPAEITLATRDGGVAIDVLATNPNVTTTPSAGQTQNFTMGPALTGELRASGSARQNTATGTVVMSHTLTPPTANWIKAGVSLRPAPAGPGQPPVANAADVTVMAGPSCTAVASVDDGSYDPDGYPIRLSQSPPGPYPLGSTLVTLSVEDFLGQVSQATATVTVIDGTPPIIAAPPAVSASSTAGGVHISDATLGTATASDNCSAVTIMRTGVPAGNVFPVGTTTITYVATDASGNTASATQIVTVANLTPPDATPPVVTVPADVTVDAIFPAGAPVTYAATAGDNVGVASFNCSAASGGVFPIGMTTVSCTATDAAGNSTTASFGIRVRGAEEQIVALIELARAMPLSPAIRARLLTVLETALDNPRNIPGVCRVLDAFIALVRSQSGRTIPADRASQLIVDATRIKAVLGC
jgi:hypothetical protein